MVTFPRLIVVLLAADVQRNEQSVPTFEVCILKGQVSSELNAGWNGRSGICQGRRQVSAVFSASVGETHAEQPSLQARGMRCCLSSS